MGGGGDCIHDLLILEGAHFQDVEEVHKYDRLGGCYTQIFLQGKG